MARNVTVTIEFGEPDTDRLVTRVHCESATEVAGVEFAWPLDQAVMSLPTGERYECQGYHLWTIDGAAYGEIDVARCGGEPCLSDPSMPPVVVESVPIGEGALFVLAVVLAATGACGGLQYREVA